MQVTVIEVFLYMQYVYSFVPRPNPCVGHRNVDLCGCIYVHVVANEDMDISHDLQHMLCVHS